MAILVIGALGACKPSAPPPPHAIAPAAHAAYVIATDWHTGIVIARSDIQSAGYLPEAEAFRNARFLEIGWGDREYYPSPRPSIAMALGAAFASSASVVHLAGYDQPPQLRYPSSEVVAVPLSPTSFGRLVAAIDATFDRAGGMRAEIVAPGLYRDSHFYRAHGRFSLSNTCNTWTARMLAAAGVDISPAGVTTASDLMERVRALPGVIYPRAP